VTEYNWPVFSDKSRPTPVLDMFFGCDKQRACMSVVLGVYLMYQTYLTRQRSFI